VQIRTLASGLGAGWHRPIEGIEPQRPPVRRRNSTRAPLGEPARGLDLLDHGAEDRAVIDLLRNVAAAFARLLAPHALVAAENLILRHQLTVLRRSSPRPRLCPPDRWLIATLATRTCSLLEAVIVVRPATVLRWHRAGWRLWWRCRSSRPVGRPPIDAELRALIRRMWRENLLWGENRIAGELAKLGWRVSPRTVAKYRPKHLQRGRGQSWGTFLRDHASQAWACDFFTVVTVHFRTLYGFVVTSLERRRIVHVGVTAHPTGAWVAQRMIEAVGDTPPRYLLHDRDSIYDACFRARLRGLGVRCLLSPPRAPGWDAPSRLPRSRPALRRAPRRARPSRVRPLLPRPPPSQPARRAPRRRALARSGTSSHIP
jgi:hypothetical protein